MAGSPPFHIRNLRCFFYVDRPGFLGEGCAMNVLSPSRVRLALEQDRREPRWVDAHSGAVWVRPTVEVSPGGLWPLGLTPH